MHELGLEIKGWTCTADVSCPARRLAVAPKLLIMWNMTLFRDIQLLLERTYGSTRLNFEDFLLTPDRSRVLSEMAGTSAAEISDLGRVFLRVVDGKLRLGIYYDATVIETLTENNPAYGLNDDNIGPFMVFLEELDHAVHAALKFQDGARDVHRETFVRDLELQAKIDTYLILQKFCAFFNKRQRLSSTDRRWLTACVFQRDTATFEDPTLTERYRETNRLARRYVRHLDRLSRTRRTAEIRRFRKLAYAEKCVRIASVAA